MSTLRLTASEGEALRVAEVLVGKVKTASFPSRIAVDAPGPALCEAVGRTLAASCLQLLLSSGGGEERVVLREDHGVWRRRSGRLWDPGLNALFDVRFGRSARAFWWSATQRLVPLAHRKRRVATPQEALITREDRKVVKETAPDGFDGVGDLLFFALAHEHIGGLGLPPGLEEELRHELRCASPLALLLGPDDPEIDHAAARGLLHTLTAPAPMRCVECVDDLLVEAWLVRFRTTIIHSAERGEFLARLRAFNRVLRTWLSLLDGAGRMDLSRSVLRFLALVPTRGLPVSLDLRNHCLRLPGTTSIAQRDEALRAIADVLDLRLVLDDSLRTLGAERYGDDRYEEGQLFLRMHDAELSPARGGLDAMARTVSGVVG